MAAKTTSWLTRARVFRTLLSDIQLAIRLLREPMVPAYLMVVPFAAVAYVLSPLDFIPDFIPIVGQLDDIGFLILGLKLFLRLCPADAVTFHQEAIVEHRPFRPMSPTDTVIDAQFRG